MHSVAMKQVPLQMKSFSKRSLLIMAVIATLIFVFSFVSWRSDLREVAPALDHISQVKVQLMESHLLFEEMKRGIIKSDYAQVHKDLEKVHQMVEASIHDRSYFGSASDDSLLREHLNLLHKVMHTLLDSQKEDELQHDQHYYSALFEANEADKLIHRHFDRNQISQRNMFTALMIAWSFIMLFLLWRWREISRNFSVINDKLNILSYAVEQTGESMLISDKDGTIEYVNPAFEKVTGYSSEDVLGKNPSILSSGLQDGFFYQKMWEHILDGKVWLGEVVDKRKDGSLYRAEMSISPITDDSDHVSYFVAVQRDITELREAQENLVQAKKMESVGTMCCGLAHDMNNSLSVVVGNLELLNMDKGLSKDSRALVEQAETATLFAATMVQDLMEFSSKDRILLELHSLDELVKNAVKLLRPAHHKVTLEYAADEEPSIILADAEKIHRILLNLVCNACDALQQIAEPKVSLRIDSVSSAQASRIRQDRGLAWEQWVCLSVSDNGEGIPEHYLEKVFDPFFTTKEVGKGTGLGLSSVYGIMQSHHGFIEVDSKESEGTTFYLYFPRAER